MRHTPLLRKPITHVTRPLHAMPSISQNLHILIFYPCYFNNLDLDYCPAKDCHGLLGPRHMSVWSAQ